MSHHVRRHTFPRSSRFASPARSAGRALLWSGLLLSGLLSSGCEDPACVFGSGGCQQDGAGSAGGIGSLTAGIPSNGDLILDEAPFVASFSPRDSRGTPRSVITLVISESLDPASLLGGFELVDLLSGAPVPILQPPLLTGGGRVVILVPAAPLQVGQSIRVQPTEDAVIADLTGQPLSVSNAGSLAEFSVADAPTNPSVVTIFPGDDATNQSELTEIVVVFDRAMDDTSFTDASFDVRVNQAPPGADPLPSFLRISGPADIAVTQVWSWRGLDGAGDPVSLGQNADVDLVLSPSGSPIMDTKGNELPTSTFEFRTAPIGSPTLVAKAAGSLPADAIGMPNLASGMPVLEVTLAAPGQSGDQLGVFLTGATTTGQSALLRRVAIPDGSTTVNVLGAELDLLTAGGDGLFLTGDMHVAVRHERGAARSAVRLMDTETSVSGTQPLIFDVTPPNLVGFGADGSSSVEVRSDMRGLVVVGRADDEVREVEVITATLGDTGMRLDVVASSPDGLFVARPVSNPALLDIIDQADLPQAFDIRLFDRAMNASATVSGSFVQTGVVGGGGTLPGPRALVDVFDANTLLPIAGAVVMTQQDNVSSVTDRSSVITDSNGHAEPLSATSGETIVIVDADGYDLFTFHGVATQRLQVPLVLSSLATAVMRGTVIGAPGSTFGGDSTSVTDSRRLPIIERVVPTQACSGDAGSGLICAFGPGIIQPLRLGAQAFMATNDALNLGNFSELAFLRAFDLRLPAPATGPGQADVASFSPALLGNLAPGELPKRLPDGTASIAAAVSLGTLDGPLRVSIEGIAPGLPDTVPVGRGLALDAGSGNYDIRGAYSGTAYGIQAPLGDLVDRGSIEADLMVEVEAVDIDDNRVGRRRRLSDWIAGTGAPDLPDVPSLLSPSAGSNSGAAPYDLSVRNVIRDASSQGGLYHVVLTDPLGRDWHLWRADPSDAAGNVRIHVSDLSGFGRAGLANGPIVAQPSVHAWSGFSASSFLWTDIDRIQDQFGHAAATTFTQP
ncbi:MAG: hypothetical protein ACI8QZ_000866 [Chlamydiales bacterium]|jgi:hypothetical protein